MARIVITGATGFTGRFILQKGLEEGHELIAWVRKTSNIHFLKKHKIPVYFVDLLDEKSVLNSWSKLLEDYGKPDYFIHNAGLTQSLKSSDYIYGNFEPLKIIVSALKKSQVLPQKFLYISSLAAHGPIELNQGQIHETSALQAVSDYGKSKVLAEEFLQQQDDFPWIIMRPTAIYGPGDQNTLLVFQAIKRGLEMYPAGKKQLLSFIYVSDFAKAIFKALGQSPLHETYVLSDGNNYKVTHYQNMLKQIMNKKTIRLTTPYFIMFLAALIAELIGHLGGRVSILSRSKLKEIRAKSWACNTQKIENICHFQPDISLEEGLRKTLKWYQKHGWI